MEETQVKENARFAPQEIDYQKIARILWSRWYWIAGCITISMLFAYIYLWYTPKTYSTSASLKFDEKKNEISELLKGQYVFDRVSNLESESYVIRSRELLLKSIKKLNYQSLYFLKGRIRVSELYPSQPFQSSLLALDSTNFFRGPFEIKKLDNKYYNLSYIQGEETITNKYPFNSIVEINHTTFNIEKANIEDGSTYVLYFNIAEDLLPRVSSGLSMEPTAKNSNIMNLKFVDQNPFFSRDILNAIINEYIEFDKKDRSQSVSQTIEFIDQQLLILKKSVGISQQNVKNFKEQKKIFELKSSASLVEKKQTTYEDQLADIKLQTILFQQIEDQIKNNRKDIYLNFNLETSQSSLLNSLIQQLNSQILDKNRKLNQYNKDAKPLVELNQQIEETKNAIVRNIELQRDRNNKTLTYIAQKLKLAEQTFNTLPAIESEYLNLDRDYTINEKVYSFLSEKKLEAQISKAAVLPGSSIVNEATLSFKVITPQAGRIYSSALLIGLTLGIGFIVLVRLVNPYIYDKETVESLTTKPIIGVIRKFPVKIDKNNKEVLSIAKPKSAFSESVRSVRTNLSFLASEKNSKIICVTSEIAGEGKSFITVNLASTLSLIDKKVIVIAADLRKSKLHKTFQLTNVTEGLSTYLSNQSELKDIIHLTKVDNLHFIPAGPNPPNPSELLHGPKMEQMARELAETYDFVIIDTAPVGLVSDSIPIIRFSDVNLFIIRSGVSRYNAATIPERLSREYNLNNVVIILNAFGDDPLHLRYYSTNYMNSYYNNYYYYSDYSGYYGSGYFEDEKPEWWQLFKKFKLWKNKES